jgi:uncharacterized protein (TIGR02145 family)
MKNKTFLMTFAILIFAMSAIAQETGTFTDSRDGKTYKTVKIGTQTWMAENLNYEANHSYCYNNDTNNCKKYGRLYTQVQVMRPAQFCPDGWHIPSESEWEVLIDFLGGKKIAAEKMKSKTGWAKNGNGTNSSGFNALPGGYLLINEEDKTGSFKEGWNGYGGVWWMKAFSFDAATGEQIFSFYNLDTNIRLVSSIGIFAFSIRCMKD